MALIKGARIQTTSTGYRIAVGEESSDEFDFGDPAEWTAPNGDRYLALVDLPGGMDEGKELESAFEHWLYKVTPVMGVVEELEEGGDEGEGEDEDEGDDGEDDEDDGTDEPAA